MKIVVIASNNPVKINAVGNAFSRMFPDQEFRLESTSGISGVSDQPLTDDETLQGAINRAVNARKMRVSADYWVGIEGGIEFRDGEALAFAWIVTLSVEMIGKGRTGSFYLPPKVAELIREGRELGEADDIIFNRKDSKRQNGAIGILTGDVIDRSALYEHGAIMSLIVFKCPELFSATQ
ncbi:MAG: inosine/xanthosine triphosphatase [Anaerolineales bacterium]|jgi:inosine/xanthosine triphosphatase